jgi:predicted DCC family thiol-disulfide oxidoreductase YuxK
MSNPNCADAAAWPDDDIILYDGFCVLCSGWTHFVLVRDTARLFRFTPIQSDYGRALAVMLNIGPVNPDTNAVFWHGFVYRRSDAALLVVALLPGLGWVKIFRLVPRILRDGIYRLIARNRYGWFGQHTTCDLGQASPAGRVITALPSA